MGNQGPRLGILLLGRKIADIEVPRQYGRAVSDLVRLLNRTPQLSKRSLWNRHVPDIEVED